jgi:hypothetical protein
VSEAIAGQAIDIDACRKTVETLRARELELSQLVDMVPGHLWRLAPNGEPIFFNKRMVDFLGLAIADTDKPEMSRLETFTKAVIHPDDTQRFTNALNRCLITGESFAMRYRLRRTDGVYRWMSSRAEPMRDGGGHIVQWYGLSHDIDDQVHAEETLQQRERELSQLVDMVPSHLWRLTPEGETTLVNKRLADFLGVDATDRRQLEEALASSIHAEDAEEVGAVLGRSLLTGEPFAMNYRLRRADGAYRWMSGRAEPMRDQEGRIVHWYGLCHDMDDQVHAEQALRERERFLWQLVDTVPAMIDCAAPDGEPIYRNQQLREFLGYELEELDGVGKSRLDGTLDAGVHPDDVAGVKERYAHSLSTGEPYARRHRLRRFDGEYRWVETRAAPMRNAEGAILQWNVICLDIDSEVRAREELRLAQEKVARASQAASLAELSASIAHEVNQPLAAIVANSHACQNWLSTEPPNVERAKTTAERIIRDANSAGDVVSRVRALFRQEPRARSSEDVNRLISDVCELMADEIAAKDTRIEIDLEPDLPSVALDRVQVQQVLVNLIRNGIEAMDPLVDGTRVLQIRCCRDDLDAVSVVVRDTGTGFKNAERVFEAFFTTKPNGMGMGLAICRSIIESHGGRLWAANNETRGATVAFTLPCTASETP